MLKKVLIPLLGILFLTSCGQSGPVRPSVAGSKFEILVVMDEQPWAAEGGRALVALLNQDMVGLPQFEPVMDIKHCTRNQFSDLLKPSRNVLVTEINPRFERPRIVLSKNNWAQPQSVVKVEAANDSAFAAVIKNDGQRILDYFLSTERDRQIDFNKGYVSQRMKTEIEKKFGIQIDIPTELSKVQKGKDFMWITNDHTRIRKDLVIYSYPYTDKKTFTREYLVAKRDSVMKANIPGEFEGSYMGTETVHLQPVYTALNLNNTYCGELKGLWKIFNGGSMGGPFYSHTRVDEINQRVITIEGFIFAPAVQKRNHIRQMEAIIYTAKLPQEINAINEVSVVADKKVKQE